MKTTYFNTNHPLSSSIASTLLSQNWGRDTRAEVPGHRNFTNISWRSHRRPLRLCSVTNWPHTHTHSSLSSPQSDPVYTRPQGKKTQVLWGNTKVYLKPQTRWWWCNRSLQRKTAACHQFIQMRAFVTVADDISLILVTVIRIHFYWISTFLAT